MNEIEILRQEIQSLRSQVAALKAENADIKKGVEVQGDILVENIMTLMSQITEIHEYLMPVVHKVFPEIATGQRKIAEFLKKSSRSGKEDI